MSVRRKSEQGDTIVEVLLAMSVLATVLTICISLMNYGFSLALQSMDRTNTQALMNGQAALLRVARDKYVSGEDTAGWQAIISSTYIVGTVAPTYQPNASGCSATAKRFYLQPQPSLGDPKPWEPVNAATLPTMRTGTYPAVGDGMWIQAYRIDPDGSTGSQPYYYDFYIKSCWYTPGSKVKQEAKTIVRLYAN